MNIYKTLNFNTSYHFLRELVNLISHDVKIKMKLKKQKIPADDVWKRCAIILPRPL